MARDPRCRVGQSARPGVVDAGRLFHGRHGNFHASFLAQASRGRKPSRPHWRAWRTGLAQGRRIAAGESLRILNCRVYHSFPSELVKGRTMPQSKSDTAKSSKAKTSKPTRAKTAKPKQAAMKAAAAKPAKIDSTKAEQRLPEAAATAPAPQVTSATSASPKPKVEPPHPGKPEQPMWARFNQSHNQKMPKGRSFRHQGR